MGLLELCEVESKEKSKIANILEIFKLAEVFQRAGDGSQRCKRRETGYGKGAILTFYVPSPPLPFHNSATFRKNYHGLLSLCDSYPSFQPFM